MTQTETGTSSHLCGDPVIVLGGDTCVGPVIGEQHPLHLHEHDFVWSQADAVVVELPIGVHSARMSEN